MIINLTDLHFTNLSIHNTAKPFENVNMQISAEHSINVNTEKGTCVSQTSVSIVPENSAELDGEFAIRVNARACFSLDNYSSSDNKDLHVKTIQQVYPYVRAAVANITSIAGIAPIHMPFLKIPNS